MRLNLCRLLVKTEETILQDIDKIKKIVEELSQREKAFIDVRLESSWNIEISRTSQDIRVVEGSDKGAAVRAFAKGAWGFSSTQNIDPESIRRCIENAIKIARAREGPLKIVELDPLEDHVKYPVKVPPENVDTELKVRDVDHLASLIKSRDYVKSYMIRYLDLRVTKAYVSSDGREIIQEMYYSYLRAVASGRERGIESMAHDSKGSRDGYTIWSRWSHEKIAETILRRLEGQLRGRSPKPGRFTVIMAPDVVGVFVHEVFGHLAEADITMSGSVVKDKKNMKIGSELVTIVDDCEIENGFGTLRYDDEGVKARTAILVENGVFRELMVDRTYAAMVNQEPTGNARAESFRVQPLIRMRNTVMLPRDANLEEMIRDIDYGYYLVSVRGGEANLDGTFQVGISEAYEIVNGEIGSPVKNMSISGNVLDILSNVEMVGKDFGIEYGMCGKGQLVFVSTGGPHVKVRNVQIGGFSAV